MAVLAMDFLSLQADHIWVKNSTESKSCCLGWTNEALGPLEC